MPRDRDRGEEYARPIRRLLVALLVMSCLALFLVWRIDSPRVERMRAAGADAVRWCPTVTETKHGVPKATDPGSASSACAHAF